MPQLPDEPREEHEEVESIEVEPGPEPEETQEAQELPALPEDEEDDDITPTGTVNTIFGRAHTQGSDHEKIIRRIRNVLSDALNRHERFLEVAQLERSIITVETDPLISHYGALDELDRAKRLRDGIIMSDRSSMEAIRQELDTLQRTLQAMR